MIQVVLTLSIIKRSVNAFFCVKAYHSNLIFTLDNFSSCFCRENRRFTETQVDTCIRRPDLTSPFGLSFRHKWRLSPERRRHGLGMTCCFPPFSPHRTRPFIAQSRRVLLSPSHMVAVMMISHLSPISFEVFIMMMNPLVDCQGLFSLL